MSCLSIAETIQYNTKQRHNMIKEKIWHFNMCQFSILEVKIIVFKKCKKDKPHSYDFSFFDEPCIIYWSAFSSYWVQHQSSLSKSIQTILFSAMTLVLTGRISVGWYSCWTGSFPVMVLTSFSFLHFYPSTVISINAHMKKVAHNEWNHGFTHKVP